MDSIGIISGIIGIIGTVGTIIFAYLAFRRNERNDIKNYGEKDGRVMTELNYIKQGVDDIKRKQEKQDQQHIDVITRLATVEDSVKSAHKRIDHLEKGNKD